MTKIDLGRITPIYRGDYDSTVSYNELDIVYDDTIGKSFIAKQASKGKDLPVDKENEYWGIIAKQGPKGTPGEVGPKGDKGDSGDKLQTMSLSMTYNENEPDRYSKVLKRYTDVAQSITLVNMVNISSDTASDVTSSSESILQQAITDAKTLGYKIAMIKPHVGPNRNDGFAKFKYVPDDISTFFSRYSDILLMQASLCNLNNIPILCISNELDSLISSATQSYWSDIVNNIKNKYPNLKLTAAVAGAYSKQQEVIYNLVDIIGVNWYPEYYYGKIATADDIPSDSILAQGMMGYHANDSENPNGIPDINYFFQKAIALNKPIYFTETGVMPKPDGLSQLITSTSGLPDMYEISAAAIRVFFSNMASSRVVIGINWWHAQEPFNITSLSSTAPSVAELEWKKMEDRYLS